MRDCLVGNVFHNCICNNCESDDFGNTNKKMAGMKITFSDYPRNAAFLLELREQVNKKIEECL